MHHLWGEGGGWGGGQDVHTGEGGVAVRLVMMDLMLLCALIKMGPCRDSA